MARARLRDLGITIGSMPTGHYNAITDVPGVQVGHCTVIQDEPSLARTGVTVIIPRQGEIWDNNAFAGYFSFNGFGEMTGLPWLDETGILTSAIGLTNTNSVGIVRNALVAYPIAKGYPTAALPVAAETYDGWLSDIDAFHISQEHAFAALEAAKSGPVEEGNVGGGTGMICHDFKGGIGTSSRIVNSESGQYIVGVLVQANYGDRALLRVDGVPVGMEIPAEHTPLPWQTPPQGGSIIIVIATDAPLLPDHCKRLARRATVGLARVGGVGYNGSGDIFLAFATGNDLPSTARTVQNLQMIPHRHMNPFFDAVAEATEEAILNALTTAETMVGFRGHIAYELPLEDLKNVMAKYRKAIGES